MKHGRSRAATRRTIIALLAVLLLVPLASSVMLAVGPPFGSRPSGTHIVDEAGLLNRQPEVGIEQGLQAFAESTGIDIAVVLQVKPRVTTEADADADAAALRDEWGLGGSGGRGVAMVWDLDRGLTRAVTGLAFTSGLEDEVDTEALAATVRASMADPLAAGDWVQAVNRGVFSLTAGLPGAQPTPTSTPTPRPDTTTGPTPTSGPQATPGPIVPELPPAPPGPPYPEPVPGLFVYDHAAVFRPETRTAAAAIIAGIRERTGAEIVVYTQMKPESDTPAKAERDAIELIDQYGVGRLGFDDGLAILFDLSDPCHGQVQLYAAPGYRASYLTNEDRQRIFEQDMLPHLRRCDLDGALMVALTRIDAATTADRARQLQLARQVDAATGLVLAPLLLLGLVGWAGASWFRYGRDPQYLDDPSIHMPAPPPGLTPAAATVILDGRATRHAVTTALVDLAGRGELRFRRPDPSARATIDILDPDTADPRVLRNRAVALGTAERFLLGQLHGLRRGAGPVTADQLERLMPDVSRFEDRLEESVVEAGWFRETPERSTDRWSFRAGVVLVVGVVAGFIAWNLPSSGLLLLGGALVAAAIVMFVLARAMPQRTMSGAMVHAWLAAYRRTLERTLAGARSMDEVVASHALPWVETPDQALVWGFALGLHHEVEDVLERSIALAQERDATGARAPWVPAWYIATVSGTGSGPGGGSSSGGGGLFSSSALPDFGAMTAVLSTIGASEASSSSDSGSSSSSGGFSGGSSGGGGGGAGGGF
ncbi:MAG: TPM domain-containing protein [Chloroflexi bacterium]|nr:TPM domain-containing protein [Chloroflexota bacterium]